MRLLLLAPPGAGKGTQAERLSKHFGIEHISSGELLRQAVAAGTPLGRTAKAYLARGDLVPDELVREIIFPAIAAAVAKGGYILDGFPRNLRQAEAARRIALELGVAVQGAIYIQVSYEAAIQRLLHRATREDRADDNEATIRHRLEVYERETVPLLDFYRDLGLLVEVDGEQPVDQVNGEILDRLAKLVSSQR